jgi:hypothetical protein
MSEPPGGLCLANAAKLMLAAVLALALAGCGESAAQRFRKELDPIKAQAQTERSQIAATLQSVRLNDRQGAQQLDQEIAALASTFGRMARIKAPGATAQAAFGRYLSANMRLVAALYRLAGVVGHGTPGQLRLAGTGATDAAGAVQRGSDGLDAALGS